MDKETLVKMNDSVWHDLRLLFCGTSICYPDHSYGSGCRPYYLLHFIHSGKGRYKERRHSFHLHAGQVFLIHPNEMITYVADKHDPWSYSWIGFDGILAEEFMNQLGFKYPMDFKSISENHFSAIEEDLRTMIGAYDHTMAADILNQSLFLHILSLMGTIDELSTVTVRRSEGSADSILSKRAVEIIQSNYGDNLTIAEIAERLNTNRSYLSTVFKQNVGLTLQKYLTTFRISRAEELLFNTDWSISCIAEISGFNSQSYFSKVFKKETEMAPQQYRQWRKSRTI